MGKFKLLVTGFVGASALLVSPAFADVGPIDNCTEASVGYACDNAGENADQVGACQKDMCTRQTPSGPMTYECFVCRAGVAPTKGTEEEEDDGCSVSGVSAGSWAGLVAPLAALGLWRARRRRSQR